MLQNLGLYALSPLLVLATGAALPGLVVDLALAVAVAALTGLLFRRLGLPVVLGYVLAGLVVGPHVPIPLVADERNVSTLAELGVTLLMFSIGLEFSLRKLFQAGPTALLMGSIQVGMALVLGYLAALGLGWTRPEAVFTGAALAISSTMVLAKLFEEVRPPKALREVVFSVLVVQDLFAILLLTALTTFARVGGLHAGELGGTLLRLGVFLLLVLGLGRLVVPRLVRWVADHASRENLLLACTGLCLALSVAAAKAGFSVALGAFLAGMLVAESGRIRSVEALILPLRDLFAAVFFVAVGMMIVPTAIGTHLVPILLLSLLVVVSNTLSLTAGGLLAGLPLRTSLRAGMTLSQIGEFGFIILGTGIAAGVVRPGLYTVGVAVGVLTAFLTPGLMRTSVAVAERVEARLPARLGASLGLYQAWAESLRRRGIRHGEGRGLRRPTLHLLLDAALLVALVLGHRALMARWARFAQDQMHWGHLVTQVAAVVLLALGAAGLVLGILKQGRVLARDLAVLAPDPGTGGTGRRGRHLLAGGLRVAVLLMVLLPVVAVLQPFAPRGPLLAVGLAVFGGVVLLQLLRSRRLDRDLDGGTEWLFRRVRDPWPEEGAQEGPPRGTLRALRIGPGCPSLGRRLADLDLTGRAGVSVVALMRTDGELVRRPLESELQEGDLLALTGAESALDEAEGLLGE